MGLFDKIKSSIPKIELGDKVSPEHIQNLLGDKFFELLNNTFEDRKQNEQNSLHSEEDVKAVIENYANINSAIAAAAAFVPGPLGLLGSVGEVVAITGNQMKMIYDIGCGFDKEDFLNKDLLIDIPLHAMGIDRQLDVIQNNPKDLIDSADEILMEKAMAFGKVTASKMLKKSIVKFIPAGGSLIMAIWTKMSNNKIAATTVDFFDNKKVLSPNSTSGKSPKIQPDKIELESVKLMINLIEIDRQISEEEMQFIRPIIENSSLNSKQKEQLLQEAGKTGSQYQIDYDILKASPEDAEQLLMDLAVLANRDGTTDDSEKSYFLEVGAALGFEKSLTEELTNINSTAP